MSEILIPFCILLIVCVTLFVAAIYRNHRILDLEAELRESLESSKHYKECYEKWRKEGIAASERAKKSERQRDAILRQARKMNAAREAGKGQT